MPENKVVGLVETMAKQTGVKRRRGFSESDLEALAQMTGNPGGYFVKSNAGHLTAVMPIGEDEMRKIREKDAAPPAPPKPKTPAKAPAKKPATRRGRQKKQA